MVSQHGKERVNDCQACEGLLSDYIVGYDRELRVLALALKDGIPRSLLNSLRHEPGKAAMGKLSKRLELDYSMTRTAARWAVASWALALGMIDKQQAKEFESEGMAAAPPVGKTESRPPSHQPSGWTASKTSPARHAAPNGFVRWLAGAAAGGALAVIPAVISGTSLFGRISEAVESWGDLPIPLPGFVLAEGLTAMAASLCFATAWGALSHRSRLFDVGSAIAGLWFSILGGIAGGAAIAGLAVVLNWNVLGDWGFHAGGVESPILASLVPIGVLSGGIVGCMIGIAYGPVVAILGAGGIGAGYGAMIAYEALEAATWSIRHGKNFFSLELVEVITLFVPLAALVGSLTAFRSNSPFLRRTSS